MITPTPRIALEEHFMAPGFEEYFGRTAINISPALFGRAAEALADFGERRLSAMDRIGVEKAVLSLAGPGVQAEIDTRVAVRKAREANDFLAERMRASPARYGGFAQGGAGPLRGVRRAALYSYIQGDAIVVAAGMRV